MTGNIAGRAHGGHDTAPAALYNCGSVPREVYRTAPAGECFRLDPGVLLGWSGLPARLQRPMRCAAAGANGPTSKHFVQPDAARAIAAFLLDLLRGAARPSTSPAPARPAAHMHDDPDNSAREAIAALAQRVATLGWLAPFHGLARTASLSDPRPTACERENAATEWPWLPAGEAHHPLRLAWCLCAISYLSPPLILWTRTPSLAWWRGDEVIELRWLGQRAPHGAESRP